MKNNKKLTMKDLQAQIEALKSNNTQSSKTVKKSATTQPKENQTVDISSNITVTPRSSSMLILYLLSWVAFLSNKLPFLSRFAPFLKKYIGRTSFWTMIVIGRKLFVVVNAVIGMLAIFSITGISEGSYMSAFAAMGSTYADILGNFVFKTFNYLLDFFDMKVIPTVPNDKPTFPFSPSSGYGWFTKPIVDNNYLEIAENAKNWHSKSTAIDYTPWHRDWSWSSLFYVVGAVAIIGGGFLAYNYFTAISVPSINLNPTGGDGIASTSNVQLPDVSTTRKIIGYVGAIVTSPKYLNPFKYIPPYMSPEEVSQLQNNPQTLQTVYPYQEVDPRLPWYERTWVHYFGESQQMRMNRESLINSIYNRYNPSSTGNPSPASSFENIALTDNRHSSITQEGSSHVVAPPMGKTPGWGTVGLPSTSNSSTRWAMSQATPGPSPMLLSTHLPQLPSFMDSVSQAAASGHKSADSLSSIDPLTHGDLPNVPSHNPAPSATSAEAVLLKGTALTTPVAEASIVSVAAAEMNTDSVDAQASTVASSRRHPIYDVRHNFPLKSDGSYWMSDERNSSEFKEVRKEFIKSIAQASNDTNSAVANVTETEIVTKDSEVPQDSELFKSDSESGEEGSEEESE